MKRLRGVEGKRQPLEVSLVHPDTDPDPKFDCKKPKFNEYYRVTCYSDMKEDLNRTWRHVDDRGAAIDVVSKNMGSFEPAPGCARAPRRLPLVHRQLFLEACLPRDASSAVA